MHQFQEPTVSWADKSLFIHCVHHSSLILTGDNALRFEPVLYIQLITGEPKLSKAKAKGKVPQFENVAFRPRH